MRADMSGGGAAGWWPMVWGLTSWLFVSPPRLATAPLLLAGSTWGVLSKKFCTGWWWEVGELMYRCGYSGGEVKVAGVVGGAAKRSGEDSGKALGVSGKKRVESRLGESTETEDELGKMEGTLLG
jgi:hypothetical protein